MSKIFEIKDSDIRLRCDVNSCHFDSIIFLLHMLINVKYFKSICIAVNSYVPIYLDSEYIIYKCSSKIDRV